MDDGIPIREQEQGWLTEESKGLFQPKPVGNCRQIWRVAGRESGSPELLGSPPTSPEVPRTSPEVFRRLPRKFSRCGSKQQSRGSPEVSRTSPEVPRASPEVPGLPRRSAFFRPLSYRRHLHRNSGERGGGPSPELW